MLSRTVISRTAGEDRETRAHAPLPRSHGPTAGRGTLGTWALLLLVSLLLAVFSYLNRGGVVEPRLDLVFASVERPSLLAVLFLTSAVSAAAALIVRSALQGSRQRRDTRDRRLADLAQPPPLAGKRSAAVSVAAAS